MPISVYTKGVVTHGFSVAGVTGECPCKGQAHFSTEGLLT